MLCFMKWEPMSHTPVSSVILEEEPRPVNVTESGLLYWNVTVSTKSSFLKGLVFHVNVKCNNVSVGIFTG